MGGKGGDRKSYKATSAAKAAEALAARGGSSHGGFGTARPVAGFSFGAPPAAAAVSAFGAAAAGLGASMPAAAPATEAGAANAAACEAPELSAQLDGELAQCLRHMSKRDTTTKLKALQALCQLLPARGPAELALLLPAWAYQFKRLLLDPARSVRAEAAATMAAVGTAVGRGLAPQLRGVIGPWYVAGFDPYPDAASAARRGLAAVFPGPKTTDVLTYARCDIMTHVTVCLTSTPASLGDTRRDSPEELAERHERVIASALAAAGALLAALDDAAAESAADVTPAAGAVPAAAAAAADVRAALDEIVSTPGFFKRTVGAKSDIVRRAAYGLVAAVARRAAELLCGDHAATAAGAVFGALQEREAANHPAMWEMVLSYASSCSPGCWAAINLRKAVIPRLLSLLRHGCHGSASSSLPALLPLLALLPREALAPMQGGPLLLDSILDAAWSGLSTLPPGPAGAAGRSATAAAYSEILGWALNRSHQLAAASSDEDGATAADGGGAAAKSYCEELLLRGHYAALADAALVGTGTDAELAAGLVRTLLLQQCSSSGSSCSSSSSNGVLPLQLEVLVSALCGVAQHRLSASAELWQLRDSSSSSSSSGGGDVVCARLTDLFSALAGAGARDGASHAPAVAAALAYSCCAALLPRLHAGEPLPPTASELAARLIRDHPGAAAAGSSSSAEKGVSAAAPPAVGGASSGSSSSSDNSIAALVRLGVRACAAGAAPSAADADLLLSCIGGSNDPGAAWATTLLLVEREQQDAIALTDTSAAGAASAASAAGAPGWRFLTALLTMHAAHSGSSSSGSRDWPGRAALDALMQRMVDALAAAAAAASTAGGRYEGQGAAAEVPGWLLDCSVAACGGQPASSDSSTPPESPRQGRGPVLVGWGLQGGQEAAAQLLCCCLGANAAGQVLLGPSALSAVLDLCSRTVEAVLQQPSSSQRPSRALCAAAAVTAAALLSALLPPEDGDSSSSSSSSSGLFAEHSKELVPLLVLLARMAWTAPMTAAPPLPPQRHRQHYSSRGSSDSDGSEDDAISSSGSSINSDSEEFSSDSVSSSSSKETGSDEGSSSSCGGGKQRDISSSLQQVPSTQLHSDSNSDEGGHVPLGHMQHMSLSSGGGDTSSASTGSSSAEESLLLAGAAAAWDDSRLLCCCLAGLDDSAADNLVVELSNALLLAAAAAAAAVARKDTAAAAAAAQAAAPGSDTDAWAAALDSGAVLAGEVWGRRAAAIAAGFSRNRPAAAAALLSRLLDKEVVPGWQRWWQPGERVGSAPVWVGGSSSSSSSTENSSNKSSSNNSSLGGRHGGAPQATQQFMLALCCVLMEESSCMDQLLQQQCYSGDSLSLGLLWLLLELMCRRAAAQPAVLPQQQQQQCRVGGRGPASQARARLSRLLARSARRAQSALLMTTQLPSVDASSADAVGGADAGGYATAGQAAATGAAALAALLPPALEQDDHAVAAVPHAVLLALLQRAAAHAPHAAHLRLLLRDFCAAHLAPAVLDCVAQSHRQQQQQQGNVTADSIAAPSLSAIISLVQAIAAALRADDEAAVADAALDRITLAALQSAAALPAGDAAGCDPLQQQQQLCLLHLVDACLPVGFERAARHVQQQQQQHGLHLAVGATTPQERASLANLLRHVCSSSSTSSSGGSALQPELRSRLQLACVAHAWREMAAPEWHLVLRDAQADLAAARRSVERASATLAGSACAAAASLTGGEYPAPATALALLRRLRARGALAARPGICAELDAAGRCSAAALGVPALHAAVALVVAVQQLSAHVQAAGRAPQLGLALESSARELAATLYALGAATAVAAATGPVSRQALLAALCAAADTWDLLAQGLRAAASGGDGVNIAAASCGELLGASLPAADARKEHCGVDGVDAALALLSLRSAPLVPAGPVGCGPLQALAWVVLLQPPLLRRLSDAATLAAAEDEEVPEFGGGDGDAAAFLAAAVGLRPGLADALVTPPHWRSHLTAWALLLAHVGELNSSGQPRAARHVTQALRDVPDLVPSVMQLCVRLIGLMGTAHHHGSSSNSSSSDDDSDGECATPGARASASASLAADQAALSRRLQQLGTGGQLSATAAAAAPAAAGAVWALQPALLALALPSSKSAWRLLAAAVYRAALWQLPASARTWYADLRDRRTAAAVERYTAAHEAPALLAAEFAAIARGAGGAAGEVGSAASFRVRASPAAREVCAVLEIEDGATLELLISLPAAAPLRPPEVECKNRVGIRDGRLRKWLLSIAVYLRSHNSGLLDAIGQWRANLEQEFAGVEPCLICYSVISAANGQLPRLSCKQCSVRFHPACLYKWFRSSGKSTCPHCQAPW